jgi:hypothetical protein
MEVIGSQWMKQATLTTCILAFGLMATTQLTQDAKPKTPGKVTLHVETGNPNFAGAKADNIYNSFSETAQHSKMGYDYFTTKPADVISKEVELWKKHAVKKATK